MVDFRSCTVGQNPAAMEEMRSALGAGAAVAGNCYLATQQHGPVTLDGKAITKRSQLATEDQAAFQEGLGKLVNKFGPAKDCIANSSEEGYFRARGVMVAQWFSPSFSEDWDDRKSLCRTAVKLESVDPAQAAGQDFDPSLGGHCRLIKVGKSER